MANEAAMALENARLYEDARADRDPLTGFFNHRYLHERMGEEVVRAQRNKQPLSVMMLDLDDFQARQRHVRPFCSATPYRRGPLS